MACPDPTDLACFALRTLDAAALARVQEHVDGCAACRAASTALVTASRGELADDAPWARPELAQGARVDRFVIRRELGEGAASVVYAAYDPELDREVALKVLRSRGADVDDKLRREGQALARLNHPNVVTVYEVGDAGGHPYIALELVAGVTARQWARIQPRPWRAVRDVFAAAGRGLEALHRAGLVHRDVKPDNIVVAADGEVRLVDFGLVGAGVAAGTPAYMPPEGSRDARSDLYSLCAAFSDCLRDAPPRRIRAALARGTASSPEARHESVAAFLVAIADRPRWQLVVPAALALGGALAVGGFWLGRDDRAPACAIASPWSPVDRATVELAILGSGRPHALGTRDRTVAVLDAFAAEWRDQRVGACRAYHEEHSTSGERFDRANACLDRALSTYRATIDALRASNAGVVDHAVELVTALPRLADCRDDATLARGEPLPADPARRAAVSALDDELARAEVAHRAGDPKRALALAQHALVDARAGGYGPALARAAYDTADLLERAGKFDDARALTADAIDAAAAARLDVVEAKAWMLQLYLLGLDRKGTAAELEPARRAADAAAARSRDVNLRAALANTLGLLAKRSGDLAAARDHYQAALALLHDGDEAARPHIAATLVNLAVVLDELGDLAGARRAAEEASRRDREIYGAEHPSYASSLLALVGVEGDAGDYAAAIRDSRRALAIDIATYGDASEPAMIAHQNLARWLAESGQLDEANVHASKTLALAERLHGPSSAEMATALMTVANIAGERDDAASADAYTRRALVIVEQRYGPNHPLAFSLRTNLGQYALDRGEFTTAERELRAALANAAGLATSPVVPQIRTKLGSALSGQHRDAEAIRELRTALGEHQRIGGDPLALADTRWTLARALWSTGDRDEAVMLARAAVAVFVKAGPAAVHYLEAVRLWVATTHAPVVVPATSSR